MITPKIQFPPKFKPSDANAMVQSSETIRKVAPEDIWQYLVNLSDWDRFSKQVEDADFIDPNINDPHLFHNVEFTFRMAGHTFVARVLECIEPKADRPGRISWEGEIKGDSAPKISFVHAWVLSVGADHGTDIITEMLLKGSEVDKQLTSQLQSIVDQWVKGLVDYTVKHLTETNHPRHATTGGNIK